MPYINLCGRQSSCVICLLTELQIRGSKGYFSIHYLLGPNKHRLVTYIQVMYILEIRCRGSTVAELSKLTYVED